MIKYIFILVLCVNHSLAFSGVLFEDNFDNQPDWQPRPPGITNDMSGTTYCDIDWCAGTQPPVGWTYFRATGLWWGPTYHDSIMVKAAADDSTAVGMGGSGKAVVVYNESRNDGDGWGADGQITKVFDQDCQELYVRLYIMTQVGWQWSTSDDMMIKMIRVGHFDKSGSAYQFFSGGYTAPLFIWDFKHSNTYGVRGVDSFRGDPQATWYSLGDIDREYLLKTGDSSIEPNGVNMPADGQYHRYDLRVKMNTKTGSTWNSDGIMQFWYDGVLKSEKTDIKWKTDGSSEDIGWNMIGFGGNAFNSYSPNDSKAEQWYAIDDVVISTESIPTNYVIGGGAAKTRYRIGAAPIIMHDE